MRNERNECLAGLGVRNWPCVFGHLGDGNLHVVVALPREAASAEHGIGLDKKPWLPLSRSPAELEPMRAIKRAIDPGTA